MYRSIVFAALLGGVGLGAWSSFSSPVKPPGLDFSALASALQQHLSWQPLPEQPPVSASLTKQPAESEPVILLNAAVSADAVYDLPAVRRDDPGTAQASEDSCGAWSVSEAGIEAILQEMVRQGWTPPTRFDALALSQPADRPLIEALDPGSPALPVFEEPDSGKPVRDPSGSPT
jgi:hypothetical protein